MQLRVLYIYLYCRYQGRIKARCGLFNLWRIILQTADNTCPANLRTHDVFSCSLLQTCFNTAHRQGTKLITHPLRKTSRTTTYTKH